MKYRKNFQIEFKNKIISTDQELLRIPDGKGNNYYHNDIAFFTFDKKLCISAFIEDSTVIRITLKEEEVKALLTEMIKKFR